jgi:hypothetical protein
MIFKGQYVHGSGQIGGRGLGKVRGRHSNTHKGLDRSITCMARVKITFGTLNGKYDLQRLICTWEGV